MFESCVAKQNVMRKMAQKTSKGNEQRTHVIWALVLFTFLNQISADLVVQQKTTIYHQLWHYTRKNTWHIITSVFQ